MQRIHAVFFHQGAPALGEAALRSDRALQALRAAAAAHLSPAGQLQVATALGVLAALEARLEVLRHELLASRPEPDRGEGARRPAVRGRAGHRAGDDLLAGRRRRFSSSRKAVRFAGLDITVWSSDRKGPPGRLSRQGPEVLRWAVYGRPPRTTPAPRPPTTTTTPPSRTARAASAPPSGRPARSSGRPAISWPSSATTRSPPPEPVPSRMVAHPDAACRAREAGAELTRWGIPAASSRQSAVSRYRSCRAGPGGRPV